MDDSGRRLRAGDRPCYRAGVRSGRRRGHLQLVPAIAWHRCPASSAAAMAGGFMCAAVAAPLDYRNPSGAKIKLAVVKHRATGPRRRGVIFVNPGGPGLPGTEAIPAELSLFPQELLRDYDIMSWDPRGVGASTAVQCFANQAAENAFLGQYASSSPTDQTSSAPTSPSGASSERSAPPAAEPCSSTSRPPTRHAISICCARRWARRGSTTSACRTEPCSALPTQTSSRTASEGWCWTETSHPKRSSFSLSVGRGHSGREGV